jgi:cyclic pyranopterin phosphate synthase
MHMTSLRDGFGRVATDLRVSVTDRCNFRCRYCMPAEGLEWLDRSAILTFEEIVRTVGVLVSLGIREVKITGGEPLARRGVPDLVAQLRALEPTLDISMTTNGYLLADAAPHLRAAGLDRVTVSCDSLLRHRFAEITRRDALEQVMNGLVVAAREGLGPIKINTVVMKGQNEDEALGFARLARETGYGVRFIEYMPLDAEDAWRSEDVVAARKILDLIHAEHPLVRTQDEGADAAETYTFADGSPGSIGIIPSVTEPFCASCNRLRLTADGQLRACLFSLEETDIKGPLRAGASDEEIADLALACVSSKWFGHRIGQPDFVKPSRSMSQIGG